MLPFALSIFTGAFLLFQVQPLIGKFILPWFGGSPGVWTTCMLFFQTVLLAGYAYAHVTSRWLRPRQQAVVHLALLVLAVVLLPIAPSESWKPINGGNPSVRILLLLSATLGLPYFVLSSTGPLMQRWFSLSHPGRSPYRLYALSNIGSLLALVSYPFVFEPALSRQQQAAVWSIGLCVFAVVCAICAFRVRRVAEVSESLADDDAGQTPDAPPSVFNRFLWLALPATASVLLLATTNKLCQDVAVIPFLWVLPLALYLLSFIVCFDHARWYRRDVFGGLFILGAAVVAYLFYAEHSAPLVVQISGYSATLFFACMICHGEVYRLKPSVRRLTGYYLMIAAGGALGGFLVAVVAPLVFSHYIELQIGLCVLAYLLGIIVLRDESREAAWGVVAGVVAAAVLVPLLSASFWKLYFGEMLAAYPEYYREHWKEALLVTGVTLLCFGDLRRGLSRSWQPRMGGYIMFVTLGLGLLFVVQLHQTSRQVVSAERNFYGLLKVVQYNADDPRIHYFSLVHGGITHGLQFTDPIMATLPTTYYGETSGVGRALKQMWRAEGRRIGLVGLGTGSLAAYGEEDDYFRIYEINPEVERLARTRFTYLESSEASVDVIMGDARVSMEREAKLGDRQRFDLLALDAFSSDAIPVHLLTAEAFEVYLEHLKPDGVIAVHISNRYLDLYPVVDNLAGHFGLRVVYIADDSEEEWWNYRTSWMLLSRNQEFLDLPEIGGVASAPEARERPVKLWTDDYASLFDVLR